MPKLDAPLQLSPVFKPRIWGRQDLRPLFRRVPYEPPRRPPTAVPCTEQKAVEPIGEVWLTDDQGRFLNGPVAGKTLAQAVREYGGDLCGADWEGGRFPVLAKFLFTSDWLSIQVHPDDEYARRHEKSSSGKCEMWYVVRADRNTAMLLGARPGLSREEFEIALNSGRLRDALQEFGVTAEEAIFLPPGTIHALGPGLALFEVEQNCDITYRLDDYGRTSPDGKPRELHLKKGLDASRLELEPRRDLPRCEFSEPFGKRRYVLACRHFAVEVLTLEKRGLFHGSPQRVEALSVLAGCGRVEIGAGWLAYHRGETWLVPPGAVNYRLVPEARTKLVRFYVPDLRADFREPLAGRGLSPAEIAQIVFD